MTDEPTVTTIDPVNDAPAPEPAPEPSPDPAPPQHWSRNETLGLDDDTIGWIENKGLDNLQATITSHRELEKKMGGPPEMLQKWPEADDTDGIKAIYRRLGAPEDIEGYKFEFEEGASVDPDTLTWFKEKALERNMPNDMALGIALDWNAEATRVQAEQQQALEVQNQTEMTELRNAWGTKYEERLDYGNRALLALGMDDDKIDLLQSALGLKDLAQFAARIADTMGEDTIAAHTDTPAFGTTEEQVQNYIDKLREELEADPARMDKFRIDSKDETSRETTSKDFRRMEQLYAQQRELIKARKGRSNN